MIHLVSQSSKANAIAVKKMKSTIAMALVANAIYASAQNPSTSSSAAEPSSPPSTVTEYYDDCSTISTITDTSIYTYGGSNSEKKLLTTYTTVYPDTCSTGLEEKTYTITEPCTNPGEGRAASHLPYGFTETTVTCNVCGPTPVIATLTTPAPVPPIGAVGAGQTPVPAPAAPTAGGSSPAGSLAGSPAGSYPGESSPGNQSPGGQSPAGSPAGSSPSGSLPGSQSPGSQSPGSESPAGSYPGEKAPAGQPPAAGGSSPAGNASPAPYPNPNNRYGAAPTGAPSSGYNNPQGSSITPFTGAASRFSLGISSVIGLVAALGVWIFTL